MDRRTWLALTLVVSGLLIGLAATTTGNPEATVEVREEPVGVAYGSLDPAARNVTQAAIREGQITVSRSAYPTDSSLPRPRESGGGLELGEQERTLLRRGDTAYALTVTVAEDGFELRAESRNGTILRPETLPERTRAAIDRSRESGDPEAVYSLDGLVTGGYRAGLFSEDRYYLLETKEGYDTLFVRYHD